MLQFLVFLSVAYECSALLFFGCPNVRKSIAKQDVILSGVIPYKRKFA